MSTTVYVVEFGEYSQRGISGVYSTLELARAAAGRGGEVSYFALDDAEDAETPWLVTMERDGSLPKRGRPATREAYWNTSYVSSGPSSRHLQAWVMARSEQEAVERAREVLARSIAAGAWESPAAWHDAT